MNWYSKHLNFEKFASKEIMYHGTSLKNLQSVMSQGLIPNPKKRVWQEDPDANSRSLSRKSYEGIYLTTNFMTAKSSATRAGSGWNGLIIASQIENRTLVSDEDSFVYTLKGVLESIQKGYIMNEWLTQQTYIEYKLGKMEDKFDASATGFLNDIFKKVPEPRRSHALESTKPLVIDVMKSFLERNIAYIIKENTEYHNMSFKHDLEISGLSIESIPSADVAENKLRELIDRLSRKLSVVEKFPDPNRYNRTARSVSPIGFHGANKIICVMSFDISKTDPEERHYILKFHYNSDQGVADKLVEDWRQHIGDNFEVS